VFNALYSMTSVRRNVVLDEPPSGVAPGDGSELGPILTGGDGGVVEGDGDEGTGNDGEEVENVAGEEKGGGGGGGGSGGKESEGGEANTGSGRKLGIPSKVGYIAKFPRHRGG